MKDNLKSPPLALLRQRKKRWEIAYRGKVCALEEKRTETTLQVSRLKLSGTCVLAKNLCKDHESADRARTRVFRTESSSRASSFNTITNWESAQVQPECLAHVRLLVFLWSRITKTWESFEVRPCHQFADRGWDILALRMVNGILTSKHPVDEAKERKRSKHTLQERARKTSHAREHGIGM